MSDLIDFTWQRCPQGYEIRKGDHGDDVIAPITRKRETYQPFRIGIQKRVLFQVLADTYKNPEEYIKFANKFGLLIKATEEPLFNWGAEIISIKIAAAALEKEDFGELISIFKGQSFGQISMGLVPADDPKERPKFRIQPVDFINALWIQLAEATASELKIKRCAFAICRSPFAYGPGTGRRSKARFCSPKCQRADYYQKRKET